jgi:hypothetical protein
MIGNIVGLELVRIQKRDPTDSSGEIAKVSSPAAETQIR